MEGKPKHLGTENSLFNFKNTYLELLAQKGDGMGAELIKNTLKEKGEGLFGLVLKTEDIELAAQKLKKHDCIVGPPLEGRGENNNSKILYLENIDGLDMFNTIRLSKKTIACHGTITLLGNLIKVPSLDLFHCKIKNKDDYHRYKNSFHEHVPNDQSYNFIVPRGY